MGIVWVKLCLIVYKKKSNLVHATAVCFGVFNQVNSARARTQLFRIAVIVAVGERRGVLPIVTTAV